MDETEGRGGDGRGSEVREGQGWNRREGIR